MKRLREKVREVIHRRYNGIKDVQQLVPKLNRILCGWANYFRSGNASRQFAQAEGYVRTRLIRFECKRRKRTAPYWDPRYDETWYRSLGIERLAGTTRYPNPSLVLVKARA